MNLTGSVSKVQNLCQAIQQRLVTTMPSISDLFNDTSASPDPSPNSSQGTSDSLLDTASSSNTASASKTASSPDTPPPLQTQPILAPSPFFSPEVGPHNSPPASPLVSPEDEPQLTPPASPRPPSTRLPTLPPRLRPPRRISIKHRPPKIPSFPRSPRILANRASSVIAKRRRRATFPSLYKMVLRREGYRVLQMQNQSGAVTNRDDGVEEREDLTTETDGQGAGDVESAQMDEDDQEEGLIRLERRVRLLKEKVSSLQEAQEVFDAVHEGDTEMDDSPEFSQESKGTKHNAQSVIEGNKVDDEDCEPEKPLQHGSSISIENWADSLVETIERDDGGRQQSTQTHTVETAKFHAALSISPKKKTNRSRSETQGSDQLWGGMLKETDPTTAIPDIGTDLTAQADDADNESSDSNRSSTPSSPPNPSSQKSESLSIAELATNARLTAHERRQSLIKKRGREAYQKHLADDEERRKRRATVNGPVMIDHEAAFQEQQRIWDEIEDKRVFINTVKEIEDDTRDNGGLGIILEDQGDMIL